MDTLSASMPSPVHNVRSGGENLRASDDGSASVKTFLARAGRSSAPGDWRLQFNLNNCAPFVFDCKTNTVGQPDGSGAIDCIVMTSVSDCMLMLKGDLDARVAIFRGRALVEGSHVVLTKFCDWVVGRDLSPWKANGTVLPFPTPDMEIAKAHFRDFGYCIVKDVMTPSQVREAWQRLEDQAAAERAIGKAWMDGGKRPVVKAGQSLTAAATSWIDENSRLVTEVGPSQRVWQLHNKGQIFIDLLEKRVIDEFVLNELGPQSLLCSYMSNLAGPGNIAETVHFDQTPIEPPVPFDVGVNMIWMLDDFTAENGATRVMPASHRPENRIAPEDIYSHDNMVAAEAPAGSVLIIGSRTWHATGTNTTQEKRRALITYFCRYWLRTYENYALSVHPTVFEKLTDRVKTLCGYRTTQQIGAVGIPIEGTMNQWDPGQLMLELH